jgi:hypothetical protein
MSGSIFISFASQDRKVATTLCQALEGRGFHCWISSRDILPGENFQIAIVRAIRKAKLMLLVFTANSNNSAEMNKELALASQNKLTVVPLRIEDVAPNDAFAYEFATRQWIDFFSDWELAMNALASQIAHVLGPEEMEAAAAAVAAAAAPPAAPAAPPAAPPAARAAEPPAAPPAEAPVEADAEDEAVPDSAPEPEPEAPAEEAEPAAEAPFFARPSGSEEAVDAGTEAGSVAADPSLAAAPARKKGSPVPMIIGAVVLLAAAAAAAFVVLGKKPAATAALAATPASSAASAAGPTVTLAPSAASAASSAAPAKPGTPATSLTPSAVASGESAGDTAATAAPDGETKASRRRAKANSAAGAPPLRASRSDIPY